MRTDTTGVLGVQPTNKRAMKQHGWGYISLCLLSMQKHPHITPIHKKILTVKCFHCQVGNIKIHQENIKYKITRYVQKMNQNPPIGIGGILILSLSGFSVNIIKNYIDIEAPED